MKNLWIASFALLTFATHASANTACSDAGGRIQYVETGYARGIPPERGDLLSTVQIFVNRQLVSESKFYEGLNPEIGPVSAELSEIAVISIEDGSFGGTTKHFSAKMALVKNRARFSEGRSFELPSSAYVICQTVDFPVP
jgi:hypothetical protein